jgi:hypothetical protein
MGTEKRIEILVGTVRGKRLSKQHFLGRCWVRVYEGTPTVLSDVLRGLHQRVSQITP